MICQNCGTKNVVENTVEGYRVKECQRCGHLHGDEEEIRKIRMIQEAHEVELDPIIYPLFKSIQSIPTFKIEFACPGYPNEKVPPYISICVNEGGHKYLEQFVCLVGTANKETKTYWGVEASFQKKLVFVLKPNFYSDPYHISAEQISVAQKDVEIINNFISGKIR